MTKTKDAVHDSGVADNQLDPRPAKSVDLHRYQVMTIPLELQQELASLKGPRLSEEELKPLPPMEEVVKARQSTPSNPPTARATALRFVSRYQYALLGGALVLALGCLLVALGGRGPRTQARAIDSGPAPQLRVTPPEQQALTPRPSPSTSTPPAANSALASAASQDPADTTATAPSHAPPVRANSSPKASPQNLSPRKKAAFKPE